MNKTKEYAKNTLILLIGKFVTQFMSLFLLPLYTNYLKSSDFGTIDLYQTYINIFVPIFLICLDSAIFRFMIDNRNNGSNQAKIVTSSLIKTIIQALLFIIIANVVSIFYKIEYLQWVIINTILIMFSNIFLQICRGLGKNINYSIACIITGFTILFSNIILITILKFNASSILISSSLANFICIVYIYVSLNLNKIIKLKYYDKNITKKLTKYSIPLIPNALSWWIVNASDRTLISIMINTAANGIYSVSCKFSNILNSIFSIFTMSWQETASLHINDNDKDEFFSKMVNGIYILFVFISAFLIITIAIGFNWFIGNEYILAYNYIPILIIANSFNVLIGLFGGVYIAKKMTKKLTSTTLISATINLLINLMLIKRIQLYAACISTLVAYVIMAIYRYFDVQKYVKIKIYFNTILISIIILSMAIVSYFSKNIIICIIFFLINFIIFIITNKNILKEHIVKIKKN